jgi:DnaK suppressor protein
MAELDIQHFNEKLLEKERELVDYLARFEEQARDAAEPDVREHEDWAELDEDTWISVEEAEVASQTLREVRETLQRIENGTYGKCISCGRRIGLKRLEAVPWTPFCAKDQQKADERREIPVTSQTL